MKNTYEMKAPKLISDEAYGLIKGYLRSHEDDIAWEIDDFAVLRKVFIDIIGRQPKPDK